jgi:transcriptional regulator with XRE-family HTH domain
MPIAEMLILQSVEECMQMVNLGERLRILRNERNITQTELSKRIGVSKAMISSYELEQRQPSYAVLIKFAAYFGVTADFLLGLEKKRTISIDGLHENEIEGVSKLIDALRKK